MKIFKNIFILLTGAAALFVIMRAVKVNEKRRLSLGDGEAIWKRSF